MGGGGEGVPVLPLLCFLLGLDNNLSVKPSLNPARGFCCLGWDLASEKVSQDYGITEFGCWCRGWLKTCPQLKQHKISFRYTQLDMQVQLQPQADKNTYIRACVNVHIHTYVHTYTHSGIHRAATHLLFIKPCLM